MRCAGNGSVQLLEFCAALPTANTAMRAQRAAKVSMVRLERVLQSKLHLPHVGCRGRDPSEAGAAEIRIWEAPNRMIEQIVRLPPELQLVPFDDAEALLYVGIEHEAGRSGHRLACGGPKLVDGLHREGRGVEPAVRSRRIETDGLAGGIRAVHVDVGVGAIHTGAWIDVESGAPGGDAAHLPSADRRIEQAILDRHPAALAERQIVNARDGQPVTIVEGRSEEHTSELQ